MDPWNVMLQGKNKEALQLLDERARSSGNYDGPYYSNRCRILLNLGDLIGAEVSIKQAIEKNEERPDLRNDGYSADLGVVKWLCGDIKAAADIWCQLCKDRVEGKICYSDFAGGVEVPLLLWFASRFPEAKDFEVQALKFLQKRLKTKRAEHWPGPIAQYTVGSIMEEDLLRIAKYSGPLTSRCLCQAHFYIGFKSMHSNDDRRLESALRQSVRHGRSNMLEKEFYIARYELSKLQKSGSSIARLLSKWLPSRQPADRGPHSD